MGYTIGMTKNLWFVFFFVLLFLAACVDVPPMVEPTEIVAVAEEEMGRETAVTPSLAPTISPTSTLAPPATSSPTVTIPPTPTTMPVTSKEEKYQAALARQLAAQSALLRVQSPNKLQTSALLAAESQMRFPNSQADETIRHALQLLPQPIAIFTNNDKDAPYPFMHAVAFSVDGRYLAAADTRGIYLWDTVKDQEVVRIEHTAPVEDVLFSNNGQFGISYSRNELLVWQADSGEILNRIDEKRYRCTGYQSR